MTTPSSHYWVVESSWQFLEVTHKTQQIGANPPMTTPSRPYWTGPDIFFYSSWPFPAVYDSSWNFVTVPGSSGQNQAKQEPIGQWPHPAGLTEQSLAVLDSSWRFPAVSDISWKFLTVPKSSWKLRTKPSKTRPNPRMNTPSSHYQTVSDSFCQCSVWWFMLVPGSFWQLLAVSDSYWQFLTFPSSSQQLLVVPDNFWQKFFAVPDSFWVLTRWTHQC